MDTNYMMSLSEESFEVVNHIVTSLLHESKKTTIWSDEILSILQQGILSRNEACPTPVINIREGMNILAHCHLRMSTNDIHTVLRILEGAEEEFVMLFREIVRIGTNGGFPLKDIAMLTRLRLAMVITRYLLLSIQRPLMVTKVREIFRDFISWKVIQQAIDKQAKSDSIFRSMFDSQSSIINRHGILVEVSSLRGVVNGLLGKEVCVIERTDTQSKVTGRDNTIELCSLPSPMILNGKQYDRSTINHITWHKGYLYVIINLTMVQIWDISGTRSRRVSNGSSAPILVNNIILSHHALDFKIYGYDDHSTTIPDRIYAKWYDCIMVYDLPITTSDTAKKTRSTSTPVAGKRLNRPTTTQTPSNNTQRHIIDHILHGSRLFIAFSLQSIVIYDLHSLTPIDNGYALTVDSHITVNCMTITENGKYLIAGCNDSCVRIWDISLGSIEAMIESCRIVDNNFNNQDNNHSMDIPFIASHMTMNGLQRLFVLPKTHLGLYVWEATNNNTDETTPLGSALKYSMVRNLKLIDVENEPTAIHVNRTTYLDNVEDNNNDKRVLKHRNRLFVGYDYGYVGAWDMDSLELVFQSKISSFTSIKQILTSHNGQYVVAMGDEKKRMISIWNLEHESRSDVKGDEKEAITIGGKLVSTKDYPYVASAMTMDTDNNVLYAGPVFPNAIVL